jgi:hypothetical protein
VHGTFVPKDFNVTHFTSIQNKITSLKSRQFTPHHYTSHNFSYLHSIPTWIPLLVTTFFTLFLNVFSLQKKDASKPAVNWLHYLTSKFLMSAANTNIFTFISLRVAITCVSCVISHPSTINTTSFLNAQKKNNCHNIKLDLPKSKRIVSFSTEAIITVCSPLWIMIHLWQNIYFDYLWHSKGSWRSSKKSTEFHFFFPPRRGHYELLRALSLLPFVDLDTKRKNVKGLRLLRCLSYFKLKNRIVQFQLFRIQRCNYSFKTCTVKELCVAVLNYKKRVINAVK